MKIACGVQLQKWGESRAEALRGQCPVEHRGEFPQLKWPNWTTSGDLGKTWGVQILKILKKIDY